MERDPEHLIASALTSLSKGRQRLFSHIGLWIAALALLVAVVVTFADISLLTLSAESLTLKMAIYGAVTVIMFLSLEEEGERTGRTESAYKESEAAFLAAKAEITPDRYGALDDFCKDFVEKELQKRRALLLLSHGIVKEDAPCPPAVQRRLNALRPLQIHAAALLDRSTQPARSPLQDPEKHRRCRLLARLLPSLLCSVLGIGIAIGVRGTLTPAAVVEGLFKLSALLIVALRGYAIGFLYVGETEISFIRAKTRLLLQFLSEAKEDFSTDTP